MLTVKENERLTRVGPGTPMGELLRRYWQPIAAAVELDDNPVRPVKLLGESLVLYRDRQGRLGLIGDTCPHRRTSMLYGIRRTRGCGVRTTGGCLMARGSASKCQQRRRTVRSPAG